VAGDLAHADGLENGDRLAHIGAWRGTASRASARAAAREMRGERKGKVLARA
jgi:hypothetical protein